MEAVFFVSAPGAAIGVACVDDLPGDPAAEPLAFDAPAALAGFVEALLGTARDALRPLRDATCQSFPVFSLSRELAAAVADLDATSLDAVAERWYERAADSLRDATPYDLSVCLGEIRDSLRASDDDERLYVLLEEKAL